MIGAGDCPHCGGDVVFDIHGQGPPAAPRRPDEGSEPAPARRGLLGRLRRG